jgi:hypothetical protein
MIAPSLLRQTQCAALHRTMARTVCVAALALSLGGCCARPDGPRPAATEFPAIGEERRIYDAWKQYDDCIDHANLMIFGILASAHSFGYREEVRPPDSTASPPPQLAPRDPLPR